MQDEDLGDRVFHDEHVVHLAKLAEILPQPLLACLQTFQSSNGWDIVVKMPPPPTQKKPKKHAMWQKKLPASWARPQKVLPAPSLLQRPVKYYLHNI